VVLWLNAFPAKSGIPTTYSSRELLVCWKLDTKTTAECSLVVTGRYRINLYLQIL
jgi:hypothetical protein